MTILGWIGLANLLGLAFVYYQQQKIRHAFASFNAIRQAGTIRHRQPLDRVGQPVLDVQALIEEQTGDY